MPCDALPRRCLAAPLGRHSQGANYLMADDHAKWFRPNAVTPGTSNATNGDCGGGPALTA